MTGVRTRALTPTIGAVIEGVDLSQRLDDEQIASIRAALLKHRVIFFEDQHSRRCSTAISRPASGGCTPIRSIPACRRRQRCSSSTTTPAILRTTMPGTPT